MKRFMMTAVAALVFSAVAGYNYYQHSQIDPRILENAAAMADILPEGGKKECYDTVTTDEAQQVRYCGNCSFIPGKPTTWAGKRSC